jgi:calcineurin-like phosphoesterase family protein
MKTWLITDTHFNHKRLINWGRPENFEELIRESCKKIKPEDTLIHLGDICIGGDEEASKFFTNLKCKRKILVRGNHDNKSYSWYYRMGWDFVCENFRMRYKGKEILFSHMPILAEHTVQTTYLPVDMNIHGHLHGRGEYSHRAIEGYKVPFHVDIAPDINNYDMVDLDNAIKQ